ELCPREAQSRRRPRFSRSVLMPNRHTPFRPPPERIPARLPLALFGLLILLGPGIAARLSAQEPPQPAEPTETPSDGKSPFSAKITLNGYLTQAYARSDEHQILGITKAGTADYSTAALRIRADMTPDDAFVLQLAHIRIGNSPIQQLKNEVDIEWLYYQRNFGDTRLKLGRVQIPFGIYNE